MSIKQTSPVVPVLLVVAAAFVLLSLGGRFGGSSSRGDGEAAAPAVSVGDTEVAADVLEVIASGDGNDWLGMSRRDQLTAGLAIEQQLKCQAEGYDICQFVTRFYLAAREDNSPQLSRPVSEIAAVAAASEIAAR